MNVLLVGQGKPGAGSWTIRGEQLGAAMGGRVSVAPTKADFAWADAVVLVKRGGFAYADAAKRSGALVVWDAVDFWRQPQDNVMAPDEARALLQAQARTVGADLVIGATQAMAEACDGVYLPHHALPSLSPAPVQRDVTLVAYQGHPAYLGRWAQWVSDACRVRGWRFQINPPDLRAADLVVAFRDGEWDGWICREWKSGVKLVNAMAAGRPVISQDSAAMREIQPVGSVVETPEALDAAFEHWSNVALRARAVETCAAQMADYAVTAVAQRYRALLEGRVCPTR